MKQQLVVVLCLCLVLEAVSGSEPFLINAPYPSRISNGAGHGRSPPGSSRVRRQTTDCGATTVTAMTSDQKTEVVDAHNHCRGQEQSSNELKMEWDESLASLAQAWANQCVWEHNMLTDCNGNAVGQNLFMTIGSSGYPAANFTFATVSWYNEGKYYNVDNQSCQAGQMCGHYTQVVWDNSGSVGCGIAFCPTIKAGGGTWTKALYIVCDYSPAGNVVGEMVYMPGEPCTACTSVTGSLKYRGYMCQENLCVPCTPEQNSTCQCGDDLTCKNGGTYSTSTCVCKCPSGYYGPECEKSCTCEDGYTTDTCSGWSNYCIDPMYTDFMKANCAQTCSMCETDPSCP